LTRLEEGRGGHLRKVRGFGNAFLKLKLWDVLKRTPPKPVGTFRVRAGCAERTDNLWLRPGRVKKTCIRRRPRKKHGSSETLQGENSEGKRGEKGHDKELSEPEDWQKFSLGGPNPSAYFHWAGLRAG